MAEEPGREAAAPKDAGRRNLLKAAALAGGTVAASALLPGSWKKPAATIGGLPAHAQTSQGIELSQESAMMMAPDMTGSSNGFGQIQAACFYNDLSHEFDVNTHEVTVTLGGHFTQAAPGDICPPSFTKTLKDLSPTVTGDASSGYLTFFVSGFCFAPTTISWRISRGAVHWGKSRTVQVDYPTTPG